MYFRAILLFSSVLAISSSAAAACASGRACATVKTPREVSTFIERRGLCDHFRGEISDPNDPGQADAMRKTLQQIDRYCTGTDAALASLKKRYNNNSGVMKKLNRYEENIEAR